MGRKQGHWIDHGTIKNYPQEGFNNYHLLVCSECGCMHRTRLEGGNGKPFNANFCPNCGTMMMEQKEKPKTNADRIRNMSDEELARFLENIVYYCRGRQNDKYCEECKLFECRVCNGTYIGKWLQAEVKDGENNVNT